VTKRDVILRAITNQWSWVHAADVLGETPGRMRQIRLCIEAHGLTLDVDRRGRQVRYERVSTDVIKKVYLLKREHPELSPPEFYNLVNEQHRLNLSFQSLRPLLQNFEDKMVRQMSESEPMAASVSAAPICIVTREPDIRHEGVRTQGEHSRRTGVDPR
jgi:hypothetical protein